MHGVGQTIQPSRTAEKNNSCKHVSEHSSMELLYGFDWDPTYMIGYKTCGKKQIGYPYNESLSSARKPGSAGMSSCVRVI